MPKVSVIIPVYNTKNYLRECLESIINQTLKDIEIICIDDGSTDGSSEILNEYKEKDSRIKIINKTNTNAGDSRNKGLVLANGEYVQFVDSDDYLTLNALEILYNEITKNNSDICISSRKYNDGTHTFIPKLTGNFNIKEHPEIVFHVNPSIHNKLFKTRFLKDRFIKFQNIKSCNDVYFVYISIAQAENVSMINDITYIYRGCGNINNITSHRGKEAYNIFKAIQMLKNDLDKLNLFNIFKSDFNKAFFNHYNYEYKKCSPFQKVKLYFKIFMPVYSYTDYLAIKYIIKNTIYIRNINTHKTIKIFGLKIKLKNKKLILRKKINELVFNINNLSNENKILRKELNEIKKELSYMQHPQVIPKYHCFENYGYKKSRNKVKKSKNTNKKSDCLI